MVTQFIPTYAISYLDFHWPSVMNFIVFILISGGISKRMEGRCMGPSGRKCIGLRTKEDLALGSIWIVHLSVFGCIVFECI